MTDNRQYAEARELAKLLQLIDYAIIDSDIRDEAGIDLEKFTITIAGRQTEFYAYCTQLNALLAFVDYVASEAGIELDSLRQLK